ncbi:MAG: DNA-binding domain-containing protein [Silicimonas sp.]|nr:DNA-binding domain-containing protein [Silicimonas sp.]
MIVDQTEFRSAILDPEAARPEGLTDGAGRPAGRRFDVYRNNVAVSLTEALETAFPVIRALVGEANFKLLAGAFLRAHPPASPLMMFYGDAMPEFLANFGPTQTMGYMPDVARLELMIRESYHAEDSTAVDPADLQALAPDALMASKIWLAPSLRLLRSDWPVFSIWRFNTEDGAPKPQMAAEDVLIARPDMDPAPHLLPPGGGAFIAALQSGDTFGAAFEAATNANDSFDLGKMLALLIETNSMTKIGD